MLLCRPLMGFNKFHLRREGDTQEYEFHQFLFASQVPESENGHLRLYELHPHISCIKWPFCSGAKQP